MYTLADNERKKHLDAVLLSSNLTAKVHFPTRVQNESNMAVDYTSIDNCKFTKYTVSSIYNGLSDHDAQLLTITNCLYGAEQYSRDHQMLGHSIVSQHFMEP
jgi:hypothetical protein